MSPHPTHGTILIFIFLPFTAWVGLQPTCITPLSKYCKLPWNTEALPRANFLHGAPNPIITTGVSWFDTECPVVATSLVFLV
ncbi:hypothetical protein GQ44DRAFT_701064 [Phaeosphaeriaceae sp. PMI808]|nr:hypothetical protein GQ44DRAFT_701064 [Phaeosphaeriaceae sp. PMI808]